MTEGIPPATQMKPIEVTSSPEALVKSECSIRTLNPENPQDFALGRAADYASLEAFNPEAYTHDAMTDEQLTNWLRGDSQNMTRFIMVNPEKYGDYVDLEIFHETIREAKKVNDLKLAESLEAMEREGIVGFTYMYNHTDTDSDFKRRADVLRKKMDVPKDRDVWELNFCSVPGTKDAPIEQGTRLTLTEFAATLAQETTTVMFVDAGSMKEAFKEKNDTPLRLQDIASDPSLVTKALHASQDGRILDQLGYQYIDRIRYEKDAPYLDFALVRTVQKSETI